MSNKSVTVLSLLIAGITLLAVPATAPAAPPGWATIVVEPGRPGSQMAADGVRMITVDGVPYFIASWEGSGIARVYSTRGGRFRRISTITGATGPEDALLQPGLCGDGTVDAVVTAADGVYLMYDALAGGAAAALPGPGGPGTDLDWMYSVVYDLDGDTDLDIISGGKRDNAQVGWFRNPDSCDARPCGDPIDASDWEYFPMMDTTDNNIGTIMTMLPLDMDDDDDVDIFYTDRSTVSYVRNGGGDPTAHSNWDRVRIHNSSDHYMFSHVIDFDGDGMLDIVSVTRQSREVVWFENKDNSGRPVPNGYTMYRSDLPLPAADNGKAARVGDLNDDGKLDIVLSFVNADGQFGIIALLSPNDPTLHRNQFTDDWKFVAIAGNRPARTDRYRPGDGIKFDDIVLYDIDGDDDLDVMTTEEQEGDGAHVGLGVVVYLNPHSQRQPRKAGS